MKAMVRELLGGSQPRAMRVVAYGNSRLPTYRSICFSRKMALTNKQQNIQQKKAAILYSPTPTHSPYICTPNNESLSTHNFSNSSAHLLVSCHAFVFVVEQCEQRISRPGKHPWKSWQQLRRVRSQVPFWRYFCMVRAPAHIHTRGVKICIIKRSRVLTESAPREYSD